MLIAGKYEEIYPPTVEDFVNATYCTYSCDEICRMERTILKALNYDLGRPSASHFLRRALKVAKVRIWLIALFSICLCFFLLIFAHLLH